MKNNRPLLYLLALVVLVALLGYASHRTHFQWNVLAEQIQYIHWGHIVFGIALIYVAYLVRSLRWARFLRPIQKVPPLGLLDTQVMGFTAVALLGRVADLTRPYLVSRKTKIPLSLQMAVYTVERMFDMGSMALIFALALLFAPDRATLPHPEIARRVAKGALLATVALVVIAFLVHLSGEAIARWVERKLPAKAGLSVASKIRAFREGLNVIATPLDFLTGAGLSLLMWAMICTAYLSTVRAFTGSAVLAHMTLARSVVLMAASMASSVVPIPVVSWFAQILAIQQTLQQIFNVRPEPALGCGTMLLVVTFMSIIPIGLIWARFSHVSLKKVSEESEHLAEAPVGSEA